ncbi:SPOR domain-containing protein [Agarivorans sp. 1_MG-2023]|uniref:SPOR domain-containing protein n=1 Tax=Agarivorans sp. 1_MG-2023 TaxID=3062634 RepID=UPI0026E2AB4A|nr:SPOR domain-containing protein [Agarivorans sp. 1_MG-2023]MDO6764008.1 SPOR domain-containing protein [Agarivorans sp. 1_MG-2023]
MTAQFKNRLVGTIILVALGVIIIPDILDGKKTRVEEEFNSIPFAPKVDSLPPLLLELPTDQEAVDVADLDAGDDVIPKEVTTPSEPAPVKQAVEFNKPAYVVQLGTFKNANNVTRLVAKLRDAGFQAHSFPEPAVEGELNRVFVGPNVSKKTLEQQQEKLKELTGLSGAIRQFDPLFK